MPLCAICGKEVQPKQIIFCPLSETRAERLWLSGFKPVACHRKCFLGFQKGQAGKFGEAPETMKVAFGAAKADADSGIRNAGDFWTQIGLQLFTSLLFGLLGSFMFFGGLFILLNISRFGLLQIIISIPALVLGAFLLARTLSQFVCLALDLIFWAKGVLRM